jgi:hypothetical protein
MFKRFRTPDDEVRRMTLKLMRAGITPNYEKLRIAFPQFGCSKERLRLVQETMRQEGIPVPGPKLRGPRSMHPGWINSTTVRGPRDHPEERPRRAGEPTWARGWHSCLSLTVDDLLAAVKAYKQARNALGLGRST